MNAVRYDDNLVHALSHINCEKRAGRTWCNRYIEFWPYQLLDVPVMCVTCIAQPDLTPDQWRQAKRDVDERGDDRVMGCRDHLAFVDPERRCHLCGYFHKMEYK